MKKKLFNLYDDPDVRKSVIIEEVSTSDIAIIGISLKMPQADTSDEFWHNLRMGTDCIGYLSKRRQKDANRYLKSIKRKLDSKIDYAHAAYLEDIDLFDYVFFGLSPKEAKLMDPNQRIFLQTAWSVIETSGYGGGKIKGTKTGVYLGFHSNLSSKYAQMIADAEPQSLSMALTGNVAGIIPSRIAYLLDLRGPTMLVDTTCSSSLVALHLACQGIRSGDCDMAIVGGTHIDVLPAKGQIEVGILSSDGRSKTFDDGSDGTGSGEGVAAVMIKSLSKAKRDGDHIYAVVKGTAINQDGNSLGLTAPSSIAQAEVITTAWRNANVDPNTISYMEAHGTGTKLGDPIEMDGIERAFRKYTDRNQFCAVGSLKSNIGHLDAVAGLAGLIKCVLALYNKELPPSLHFRLPNRKIAFETSPVFVNDRLTKWETDGYSRICGVSAFGLGGTNCHVVLEEAPEPMLMEAEEAFPYLLVLSAKSESALQSLVAQYDKHLCYLNWENVHLRDLCYTAAARRDHYKYRLAFVLRDKKDLYEQIKAVKFGGLVQAARSEKDPMQIVEHQMSEEENPLLNNRFYGEAVENRENDMLTAEIVQALNGKKGADKVALLRAIAELYVSGSNINWDELYKSENKRIVRLPAYPFEPLRCWLDVPEWTEPVTENSIHDDNLIFQTVWQPVSIEEKPFIPQDGDVLLFKDREGRSDRLATLLRKEKRRVIEVEMNGHLSFQKLEDARYSINGSESDFDRLAAELSSSHITRIVYMPGFCTDQNVMATIEDLRYELEIGVYGLFYLVKALVQNKYRQMLDIILITRMAQRVLPDDRVAPANSALTGLGKVVPAEYSNIRVKSIDLDHITDVACTVAEIFEQRSNYSVAFRRNQRYLEIFERKSLAAKVEPPIPIQNEGIYIITGGMGGIGLELAADWVNQNNRVNIALLGRSPLPEREHWETIIKVNKDTKLCAKLSKIVKLEKQGANFEIVVVDVSEVALLEQALVHLRSTYGKIRGIVHAAGIPGDGFLIRKDRKTVEEVLNAKIVGAWALDRLTRNDKLDFFVLFSSINSLMGEAGQGDYTAANAYLDAFANFRMQQGRKTLSICWPAWKETGMAVAFGANHDDGPFKAIRTEHALNVFHEALRHYQGRIIVGEINPKATVFARLNEFPFRLSPLLQAEIERQRDRTAAGRDSKNEQSSDASQVRLKGKGIDDYSVVEQQIATIWRDTLGFEEFHVSDSFFDIGGNSILVTNVQKRIDELYPGKVAVVDLFTYPTIEELAQYMSAVSNDPQNEEVTETDEFLKLLEDVEAGNLSLSGALLKFKT